MKLSLCFCFGTCFSVCPVLYKWMFNCRQYVYIYTCDTCRLRHVSSQYTEYMYRRPRTAHGLRFCLVSLTGRLFEMGFLIFRDGVVFTIAFAKSRRGTGAAFQNECCKCCELLFDLLKFSAASKYLLTRLTRMQHSEDSKIDSNDKQYISLHHRV